jgi:DNA-binding NtrC family response regulator
VRLAKGGIDYLNSEMLGRLARRRAGHEPADDTSSVWRCHRRGGYRYSSISGYQDCLVFSDARLPGDMDGIHLARWVNENRAGLPVVMTSGDAGRSVAAKELCPAQNMAFFAEPYGVVHVAAEIEKIVETSRLQR